jgi:hypothetical protein
MEDDMSDEQVKDSLTLEDTQHVVAAVQAAATT